MELRDYQDGSVSAVFDHFAEKSGSPLVELPTGSGKSVCIAELVRRVIECCPSEQVLIVSHRKEILTQDAEKIQKLLPANIRVGLYSAGLGKKQFRQVTVAGIQSIYRHKNLPPFGLVIIDEVHLIPHGGNGMYLQLLNRLRERNDGVRLVGYSATVFRTGSGYLHEGDNALFSDICYSVSVRDLIDQGYLSTLVTKHAQSQADLSGVHTRGGEFIAGEAEAAVDKDDLIRSAVAEMLAYGMDRKSWLVFAAGVKHAEHVNAVLREKGVESRTLFGHTPQVERDRLLCEFKEQKLRALVSVDCLTTGFDAPCTDLIAMLRPTKSAGLWIQALGRGMRLSPDTGKQNCLVLDFAGNAQRLGTIDRPVIPGQRDKSKDSDEPRDPPIKICPNCQSCVAVAVRSCPDCGYEWPESAPKHAPVASAAPVLSTGYETQTVPVLSVAYRLHAKEGKPPSLRVDYTTGMGTYVSEWVCFEHEGFAQRKAARWWKERAFRPEHPVPTTIDEALERRSELKTPMSLVTRQEGKFDRIVRVVFPMPKEMGAGMTIVFGDTSKDNNDLAYNIEEEIW